MATDADEEKLWRDDPISSAAQDRLGRVELAKRIAQLINESHTEDSSVVHGLVGPWGSGKSSVLTLVQKEIADSTDGWVVVRFSPWATSDLEGLLAEFYGAIVEALPRKKGRADFKRALGEVIAATAPLASVAGAFFGAGGAGDVMKKGGELLVREKSWSARFADASQDLKKLSVKLLVVADDIDRLHGEDLLNFLRLVRLVGRFPGMSYLIAYDEAGLLSSIEAAGSAVKSPERAQDFLEKFVQYPIYLPPLIESQIIDLLNSSLDPVIASSNHRFDASGGRLSFARAWVDLLDTPRAIHRFAAQLRLVLPLHRPKEVDLVDVLLLTLLRLHAPKVFEAVSRAKSALSASYSAKDPFDWSLVLGDRVSPELSAAVQEIIERLFPGTSSRGAAKIDPPRVGNPDYFDRYFLQGIPDDDVADGSVQFAIDQANQGADTFLQLLLMDAKSTAKRGAIFSKLQRLSSWGEEPGAAPIAAFATIVSHLNSLAADSGSLLPSSRQRADRWVGQMLLCLPLDVPASEVADALGSIDDEVERLVLLENIAYAGNLIPPPGVVDVAAEVAGSLLEILVKNVSEGDSAEETGVIERWTLLLRTVALEKGRQRLTDALRDGLLPDDLAARFVAISHWSGGSDGVRLEIGGFLWDAYHELLPRGLETSDPEPEGDSSVKDISWPSRRQFALRELSRLRQAAARE